MYHRFGPFHFQEVTNFYVYRHIHNNVTGRRILRVLIDPTGTDVVHLPIPFAENGLLPYCGVRVPVLMSVRDDMNLNHSQLALPGAIQNALRQQAGVHSLVSLCQGFNRWALINAIGFWQTLERHNNYGQVIQRYIRYEVGRTSPYIVIYPCFRETTIMHDPVQPVTAPELIIGVFFPEIDANYVFTRTYCRYGLEDQQSTAASDIDYDFIRADPDVDQNGVYQHQHFTHPQMIPYHPTSHDCDQDRAIALYVCRGAKLYVNDNRSHWTDPTTGQVEEAHTRSLYQQGSLVVIRGWIAFYFHIQNQNRRSRVLSLNDVLRLHGGPNTRTYRTHDQYERNLDPNASIFASYIINNKVLFLGQCESQYNSLSWKVEVATNTAQPNRIHCNIFIPDNAIIEDIAPWRTGFALIRARHHYERLWDSVVTYIPGDNPIIPEFIAPDPGDNDYLLRRILQIPDEEDHWGPIFINFPQQGLTRIPAQPTAPDNRVYKYIRQMAGQGWIDSQNIERLWGWDQTNWYHTETPPAPPLLPPKTVWDPHAKKVRFFHLKSNEVVKQVGQNQNKFKIGNYPYFFKLNNEMIYGHHWLKWSATQEAESLQWLQLYDPHYTNQNYLKDFSQYWFRQSVDHIKYIKDPERQNSYPLSTLYFSKI